MTLYGQSVVTGYTGIGNTAVLGTYGTFALMPGYTIDNIKFDVGVSGLISGQKENFLDGIFLMGSYGLAVKQKPLNLSLTYLWKRPSEEIRETNISITVDYSLEHWNFLIGNNFRTYRLSRNYREEQGFSRDDSRIREPWNLMYKISFFVNTAQKPWNLVPTITNVDYFMIEQETNPLFNLKGLYKTGSNLELFLEAWYKTAGMLNIQVNHYGFHFRFGVIWNI